MKREALQTMSLINPVVNSHSSRVSVFIANGRVDGIQEEIAMNPISEETRKKMSDSHKGVRFSESHRRKIGEASRGRRCSEETRSKIRAARKLQKPPMLGKHHSEESRRNISEAQKGKKGHNFGKHLSEETRKKISIAGKGKQAKEKNPNWGKHLSQETRRKIGDAQRGSKHHNWQGGKSLSPYRRGFTRNVKKAVLCRDKNLCQSCGGTKRLFVHHIDGGKHNHELTNLITLCQSCHQKLHFLLKRNKEQKCR